MKIRPYQLTDYQQLVALYKQSTEFKFDEVTDSEAGIAKKVERDPESLLIAEDNEQIVGSVSIIEDGRIALLFRLVANNEDVLKALVQDAESMLVKRGYEEVHNTAPLNDLNALKERENLGFNKGNPYTWFWKKIK